MLKKFNWLLFSNNNKIFDENNEKKYNRVLARYCNYSDLYTYMLEIDDELEDMIVDMKEKILDYHMNYQGISKLVI